MTRYDILPRAQMAIIPGLGPTRRIGYTLYGGTAVALHLGHRESIDFDFFSAKPLMEAELLASLPFLRDAVALQREPDTWTVLVSPLGEAERPVKLLFFGGMGLGRVGTPTLTSGGEILLGSPLDLLGHKLKVLLQRVEAKDYRDIAALLRSGLRIEQGLGAALALFGSSFPPAEAMRALTYFGEGDFRMLSKEDKAGLIAAARNAGAIVAAEIVANYLTMPVPESDGPGGGGPGGGTPEGECRTQKADGSGVGRGQGLGRAGSRKVRERPGPSKGRSMGD